VRREGECRTFAGCGSGRPGLAVVENRRTNGVRTRVGTHVQASILYAPLDRNGNNSLGVRLLRTNVGQLPPGHLPLVTCPTPENHNRGHNVNLHYEVHCTRTKVLRSRSTNKMSRVTGSTCSGQFSSVNVLRTSLTSDISLNANLITLNPDPNQGAYGRGVNVRSRVRTGYASGRVH